MALLFFFFNDTATTEIYTLSLHDALPISRPRSTSEPKRTGCLVGRSRTRSGPRTPRQPTSRPRRRPTRRLRSEEHTSELQSQSNLVCRLLLEKKKLTSAASGLCSSFFCSP